MSKPKTSSQLVPIDENSLAWKIFSGFISDTQVTVTEDELRAYAIEDLKMTPDKMPLGLMEHLPAILVAFMNMWSGWHFKSEFLAGKFPKEHYFQRFQKFMMHKMNSTIRGQFTSALRALSEPTSAPSENLNGDDKGDPEFSPYAISIQCPAHMLNTIVFSNVGDDVIMKQHLGSRWQDLTPTQLLNWPHIEVTFRNQDLFIVRRQATEFIRYLNFLPHESNKYSDYVIEHTENYGRQECFSYDYLEKYVKVYIETLKNIPEVNIAKLTEIQTVLVQFLEDVKYINVKKSFATNTLVLFRLSPVPFIRNKKLVKNTEKEGDEARVGYCEIITPKIQLLMPYFKARQVEAPYITFESIEKYRKTGENLRDVLPYITYKCTYCKVECAGESSRQDILTHFQNGHKMEQHVRCTLCKKQFDVLNLAACRWRHKCIPNQKPPNK